MYDITIGVVFSELSKNQVVFLFSSLSLEDIIEVFLIALFPVLDQVGLQLISDGPFSLNIHHTSLLFRASCSQLVVVLLTDDFKHLSSLL